MSQKGDKDNDNYMELLLRIISDRERLLEIWSKVKSGNEEDNSKYIYMHILMFV